MMDIFRDVNKVTVTVKNMLVALAAADAYGTGFESKSREWICDFQNGVDFSDFIDARDCDSVKGKYRKGYFKGFVSDDTVQNIALIRALINQPNEPFSDSSLLKYSQQQYQQFKDKYGVARAGYGSIRWIFNKKRWSLEQVRACQRNKTDPGNATVMCAMQLGLLLPTQITEYARISADFTHPHPKARAATIGIAWAMRYFLCNGDAKDIITYCLSKIGEESEETVEYLQRVDMLGEQLSTDDYQLLLGEPHQGYMLNGDGFQSYFNGLNSDAMRTCGTALYILKYSTSLMDGFKRAIEMGGDVDTLAAIVCGILAVKYGLEGFPETLCKFETEEFRQELNRLAETFAQWLYQLHNSK